MLVVKNLKKQYKTKGGVVVNALDDVSITFPETGMVFLLGKSGSGKSTLLNVTGGLDKPDSGEIIIKGKNSKDFSNADFDSYRNTFIGFIFQEYNILNEFNVYQNVALALQLQHKKATKEVVEGILAQVDLTGLAKRKPMTLSGGQKQRVAIARALVKNPEIIMADEPTGALDSNTGKQVFDTLKKLSQTKLVIVVSHDREFAEIYGDRIIELKDGKVLTDQTKELIEAKQLSNNISVLNNTIQIKNPTALTETEFRTVFNEIKKVNNEVIISTDSESVPKIKKAMKITDDSKTEKFSETKTVKTQQYDGTKTKFIRSTLPGDKAFKIGASSLKSKPFRLIFTIFLSTVSFTMFGVLSCLMLYNESYSISNAMKQSYYDNEVMTKKKIYTTEYGEVNVKTGEYAKFYSNDGESSTLFSTSEINELNNNKVGHNYIGVFDFNTDTDYTSLGQKEHHIGLTSTEFYNEAFLYGFSDATEETLTKSFTKVLGTHPANAGEIAISKYAYDNLKTSLANLATPVILNDSEINAVNGPTFFIRMESSNNYVKEIKLTGVYDTGKIPDRFNELSNPSSTLSLVQKAQLQNELDNYLNYSFSFIGFVSPDFYSDVISHYNITSSDAKSVYNVIHQPNFIYSFADPLISIELGDLATTDLMNLYGAKYYNLENEAISCPSLGQNEYLAVKGTSPTNIKWKEKNVDIYTDMTLKGYFEVTDYKLSNDSTLIISKDLISNTGRLDDNEYVDACLIHSKYEKPNDAKYNYLITKTSFTESQVKAFLYKNTAKGYLYKMSNPVYSQMAMIVELISEFKSVFFWIGIISGAFSALLLANFITISITAKKREIGILRAVGARSIDVFKIFFSESFIIAAICFVGASIASFYICRSLNAELSTKVAEILCISNFSVLNFGLLNILIIIAVSLAISALATFLPVLLASRKPPVESIRSL